MTTEQDHAAWVNFCTHRLADGRLSFGRLFILPTPLGSY